MQAVVLALASALGFALGHSLWKLGLTGRSPVRWGIGMAVVLAASLLDLQAVSRGDLTVVKPLIGLQSVFAVAIGVGLLGERVRRLELVALAAMVAGGIAVAARATSSELQVPTPAASALLFALAALSAAGVARVARRRPDRLPPELGLALATGLLFGISDLMMKIATSRVNLATGGFSVLALDAWWSLLRTPEVIWIALANIAGFGLMQRAFALGRVSVVNPTLSVSGTAIAVALGFGLLGEQVDPIRGIGIATLLVGTALLAVSSRASA